jgi:hypothetical protein
MSINGPSEKTAEASRGKPDGRFPGLLHVVALTALVAGALGSIGLMFWVGHGNPSRVLLVLFTIWDLSPFMALLLADMISKRWSVITRATLHIVMLVIALSSLALYRERCLETQVAARFHVPCRSPGLMAAYDDSCPDSRVNIRQTVASWRSRLIGVAADTHARAAERQLLELP